MAILEMGGYQAQSEGRKELEAIPGGYYLVCITDSAMKPTKDGAGQYLELKVGVMEGQYHDSVLFDRLNLGNANETARKIAFQALDEILIAQEPIRHVKSVTDSSELHGNPMIAKVELRKGEGINDKTGRPYGPSNEIKKYLPYTPENKAKYLMGVQPQAGVTTQNANGNTGTPGASVPPTAPPGVTAPTGAPAIPQAPPWSGG